MIRHAMLLSRCCRYASYDAFSPALRHEMPMRSLRQLFAIMFAAHYAMLLPPEMPIATLLLFTLDLLLFAMAR